MTSAVVIGAGLSGLASALMLHRCGVQQVTVMEKRVRHTRDNQILLSHLGVCRLRQLGVYDVWRELFDHRDGAISEGAVTRGDNIEQLVLELKKSGRLPPDAPHDHVYLQFQSSTADIVDLCSKHGLEVDAATGIVTAFHNASPEVVAEFQQRGLGIENVKIKELEQAMVTLCERRGIKVVYGCGDVEVILSHSKDTVVQVRGKNNVLVMQPALVIDAEGARRVVAKQQLNLREVRSTKAQWYTMFVIEKYYGPIAYTVINARDPEHLSARLRHFLVANFQTRRHSLCAIQLPPQFVGELDDDDDGRLLKSFCLDHLRKLTQLHGLEDPPEVFDTTWEPFETREVYLMKATYGTNVVVIGDAARSGTFLSGTGYNLALVCDLNAVELLAKQYVENKSIPADLLASLDTSIVATSQFFHQLNLERYYG